MAPTASRDGDTDLIIIGGGPAGCAAAVMAASIGLRSILVEADTLCGKLRNIAAVGNVVGGLTDGPELADAIAADVTRAGTCAVELGARVAEISTFDDHVTAVLDTGRQLNAPHAVVATGVGPLPVADAPWLTVADGVALPTLWGARVADEERALLVLGADRPLGTFLRAHPALEAEVVVAYPPQDDYKVDEVREDPRTTLLPVASLTVRADDASSPVAQWVDRESQFGTRTTGAVYLNLGSAPAPPAGAVVLDDTGYCPPDLQHPRLLTAGDLRSPRYQRIMTATGSGAEAALHAYYAQQNLPSPQRRRAGR